MWPVWIEASDELITDLERPLFPGDSIFVTKFAWIEKRILTNENWYRKDAGILSFQATALIIENVILSDLTTKIGLIISLKKRAADGKIQSAKASAYGLERSSTFYNKQCLDGLDITKLRISEFVSLQLADIPAGWMICHNYLVPPGSSFRLGTEIMAREDSKVLACARPFTEKWRWHTKTGLPKVSD